MSGIVTISDGRFLVRPIFPRERGGPAMRLLGLGFAGVVGVVGGTIGLGGGLLGVGLLCVARGLPYCGLPAGLSLLKAFDLLMLPEK